MTLLKPCIACGEPTDQSRCEQHRPRQHELSASRRGYDAAWARLSKRARRLQPWCLDCGTTQDLTADHSTEAWKRKERGLTIRLADVEVVCRSCNSRRGAARTRGQTPPPKGLRPLGKPHSLMGIVLNKGMGR